MAELEAAGWKVPLSTLQWLRLAYERQGLWGLVDGGSTRSSSVTGRTDPRVVEAVRQAKRTPVMTWSPAHLAVEQQDLPRLRDLLDGGHNVEDDGHGWTLLRHAIEVEHDGHVQTGGSLHAAVTVFLLARGADPLRPINGAPAVAEAETRGHWLAAEIMRAWIGQGQETGTS